MMSSGTLNDALYAVFSLVSEPDILKWNSKPFLQKKRRDEQRREKISGLRVKCGCYKGILYGL